jgi:hypothetical protein
MASLRVMRRPPFFVVVMPGQKARSVVYPPDNPHSHHNKFSR